jgi:hypothetical protein
MYPHQKIWQKSDELILTNSNYLGSRILLPLPPQRLETFLPPVPLRDLHPRFLRQLNPEKNRSNQFFIFKTKNIKLN